MSPISSSSIISSSLNFPAWMALFIGPNRCKSGGTKSGLCGGWGNKLQQTSLSDNISKTGCIHVMCNNLITLYYSRLESSKLM
jgi:hypothetical protein